MKHSGNCQSTISPSSSSKNESSCSSSSDDMLELFYYIRYKIYVPETRKRPIFGGFYRLRSKTENTPTCSAVFSGNNCACLCLCLHPHREPRALSSFRTLPWPASLIFCLCSGNSILFLILMFLFFFQWWSAEMPSRNIINTRIKRNPSPETIKDNLRCEPLPQLSTTKGKILLMQTSLQQFN